SAMSHAVHAARRRPADVFAASARNQRPARIAYSTACATFRTAPCMASIWRGDAAGNRKRRTGPMRRPVCSELAASDASQRINSIHKIGGMKRVGRILAAVYRRRDTAPPMLGEILDQILVSRSTGSCITATRHFPARPAVLTPFPHSLDPPLGDAPPARGGTRP